MLITLIITLAIAGVCLYLIELIPMDATFKKVIQVLSILFALLYVLSAFGFIPGHMVR